MLKSHTTTLPNHLRVLTLPQPTAESVTVMVLVRAGSRFETKSNQGVAHFLEHMFFKGGVKYPTAKSVSEAIDGIGGVFNAFTSNEFVGYYVKVAKEHIDLAFDVLSDMLLNAHLSEADLNRERGVILEEYRMYLDNPKAVVATNFDDDIFGDHPLGRDIIGTPTTIQKLTSQDLRDYRDQFYTASNIVIAVAGQTTPSQTKKLVQRYFPYSPSPKVNRPLPFPKTPALQGRTHLVPKNTEQAHLILGTRSFGGGSHKDRYAVKILATILGGGSSSRLFSTLREDLGIAYYVYAYNHSYTDTGYFAISAGVDKKRIQVAIDHVKSELKDISHTPVGPSELAKAKEYLIGHLMLELEHSDDVAQAFGLKWLLYGELESIKDIKDRIRSVTASQVQKLARRLFTEQELVLTVVGPKALSDKIKKSHIL